MSAEPRRAHLPPEYGLPADAPQLPWSYVDERMTAAKHYWVATISPDGSPCVRPVDGIWIDGRLYFGGSPESKWRRNIAADPRISVNLEDGDEAVILEGKADVVRPDRSTAEKLAEVSNAKYGYGQKPEDYEADAFLEFNPQRALAWKLLFKDATRWTFGP